MAEVLVVSHCAPAHIPVAEHERELFRHSAWLATGSTWSSGRMASISSTIRSTLARHSAAA